MLSEITVVVPDYFWPHKFFAKWIEEKLGSFGGVDGFKRLKNFVEEFDKRNQELEKLPGDQKYASIQQTEDGQTVVVIIDRFMRRNIGNICGRKNVCKFFRNFFAKIFFKNICSVKKT